MKKTVLELVLNAESIYTAVGKARASASERIKRVNSDKYAPAYRSTEMTSAKNTYTDNKNAAINSLSKIRDAVAAAAENEAPVVRVSAVDQNLVSLLQLPLTARDYSSLARTHINNYTAIRMLEAAAKKNGFSLTAHREPETVANAAEAFIDRLINCIENDSPNLEAELPSINGVFLNESRQYVDRMLDPFKIDEIECHADDLESALIAGINKERQSANTAEAAQEFERGFTGKSAKPVDYSSFPALSAISEKLSEVKLPQKSDRVLGALWNAIDSKRLRDKTPLTAQEIKRASDATQDESLSTELRELADLILPDENMRFKAAPGLELTPVTASYNEKLRHAKQVDEANLLQAHEANAKSHSVIADAVNRNNASRQERREAEEVSRYRVEDSKGNENVD